MFTGLITDIGTIAHLHQEDGADLTVVIAPSRADFPRALGASIACDGICLTVTECCDKSFTAALSEETLRVTNAAGWKVGTRINLESSLKLGDALGGHLVSGHVDALASIISIMPSGDSHVWEFRAPRSLMPLIAPKGSVAIDGISLTVNTVTADSFSVNIIEHTRIHTALSDKKVGDSVNIEIDMLARYVARILDARAVA